VIRGRFHPLSLISQFIVFAARAPHGGWNSIWIAENGA
jgi:hypothetical protein